MLKITVYKESDILKLKIKEAKKMDLMTIYEGAKVVVSGALMIIGGASIILKYIAPKTKTLWDDKAYAKVETALKFLSQADEKLKK